MSFCNQLLRLLLLLCTFCAQADFVTLSVWKRDTPSGGQYLVCCGDKHDVYSNVDEHTHDIMRFLVKRNNPSDCILTEDKSDYEDIFEYVVQFFQKNVLNWDDSCLQNVKKNYDGIFKPSPLSKVIHEARSKNIPIFNLEYQHFSLRYPCLSDASRSLFQQIDAFIINSIIHEVQHYNDNKVLNKFYKEVAAPFDHMKSLGSISRGKIADLLLEYSGEEKVLKFLPRPDSFYYELDSRRSTYITPRDAATLTANLLCELLDARFAHQLYQLQMCSEQSNVVVACTGDAHLSNINKLLPDLSYKCIHKDRIQYASLENSLDTIFNKVNATGS